MSSSDSNASSPPSSMTSSPRDGQESSVSVNHPASLAVPIPTVIASQKITLKSEFCPDVTLVDQKPIKLKTNTMGFSIQSILARPEPIRPAPEHALSYPQHLLHYSSLAAFFPQKLLSSTGVGHIIPPLYGACWQPQIVRNDSPENLSTKPFLSTSRKTEHVNFNTIGSSDNTHIKREDNKDLLHTSAMTGGKSSSVGSTSSNVVAINGSALLAARKLISSSLPSDNSGGFNPDENNSRSPSPTSTDGNDDRDGKSRASSPTGSHSHRRKKTRTVFSRSQVFQLESTFDLKRYLSSADRAALAASLNLSEQQIKIWFQNRRNKWKRQISSDSDSALISAGQMHAAAAAAGRFGPGHHPAFPMSLYSFPGNMSVPSDASGNPSMGSLFCQGPLHPLYLSSQLPFSRSSL